MAQVLIRMHDIVAANTDIDLPGGVRWHTLLSGKIFSGAAAGEYVVDAKGDGNAAVGHIKLQADGKKVRTGDIIQNGYEQNLVGVLAGEVQGYGDGT